MDFETVVKPTEIGAVTQRVVDLLKYDHEPGIIKVGPTNVRHMKTSHPRDYAKYKDNVIDILMNPDYVGVNPGDGSIQFVKILDKKVAVAVRVSLNGTYYCRSVYALREDQFHGYLTANRLFKVE